ncbi:MAG: hypothetical protein ACP5RH_08105 [Leptodesmis sp.]|uniref:hypothetical protein n=1 Tax=Leptodesmis sp. TaxID=3100501 RepID=UPI003D102215
MKLALRTAPKFVLTVIPALATAAIAALPTQAATFSFARADAEISNFNQIPLGTDATTNTQATSVFLSPNAAIATVADAQAAFITQPVNPANLAFNFATAQSQGSGDAYLGQGNSLATVLGTFSISPKNTFSFSFAARLGLKTSVDNPEAETANAWGSIVFRLFDSNTGNLLDTFGLTGQSTSQGTPVFQAFSNNSNFAISPSLDTDKTFFVEFGGVYLVRREYRPPLWWRMKGEAMTK